MIVLVRYVVSVVHFVKALVVFFYISSLHKKGNYPYYLELREIPYF